jgi:hypothetical protein
MLGGFICSSLFRQHGGLFCSTSIVFAGLRYVLSGTQWDALNSG